MTTSIQISEVTKEKLVVIMAKIQAKKRRKITYEDAIVYLIEKETQSFDLRRRFVKKYRNLLDYTHARKDLQEARNLERNF